MKQQPKSEWVITQPGIVMFAVSSAQSHRYMSVENGQHKRQAKKYGPRKRVGFTDAKQFAQ